MERNKIIYGKFESDLLLQTGSYKYRDLSIPVILVYMIGQKYIVGGMTSGAVKE